MTATGPGIGVPRSMMMPVTAGLLQDLAHPTARPIDTVIMQYYRCRAERS
jgi:hypothetical protein